VDFNFVLELIARTGVLKDALGNDLSSCSCVGLEIAHEITHRETA